MAKKMKSGSLSVPAQIGIIVAVFAIAFLVLYGFLYWDSLPPSHAPVDQAILNAQ